jgi:serine/threonine-protein kinase RsbW
MHTETSKPTQATTFERSYPGTADQVGEVRADLARLVAECPFTDALILLASELVTNAVLHSRSGLPGGTLTVRVEVHPGDYAWLEVQDQGGPWGGRPLDDEHGRGLELVAALAGEGNWLIADGDAPGTRVALVRLGWMAEW